MSEYQLELKQIVDYPRCRIYRQFIGLLMKDKNIRVGGTSRLYHFTVLSCFANFRTSYKRIDGISYTIYPGEWLCRVSELTEWFRTRFQHQALAILRELQDRHLITYTLLGRGNIKFATYAEKVVTNGLRTYCRLMCGKQKHHISLPVQSESEEDGLSMEQLSSADDTLDKLLEEQDICMLLQNCKRQYTGTARLGIEAIEWKVKGLSGAEIAKMYGVKPNLVGAWISRAAGRLKQNRDFMQYFDRSVEIDSS